MKINMILASTHQGVIGNKGDLPWRNENGQIEEDLKEDLIRFGELTDNQIVILGGNTAMGFLNSEKPFLPRRMKIIVSAKHLEEISCILQMRGTKYGYVVPSLEEAYKLAERLAPEWNETAWVIGGARIYKEAIERGGINKVYLTRIMRNYEGDTVVNLEILKRSDWRLIGLEYYGDKKPPFGYEQYINLETNPDYWK
jgi:dihydrofolate reductase